MQVAGRPCEICRKPIASLLVASWCPDCGVAFHSTCIDNSEYCPECQRSFAESAQAHADRKQSEFEASLRAGRETVLKAMVTFLSARVVLLLLTHLDGGKIGRDLGTLVASVFCLVYVYMGERWARFGLQLSLAGSVVLNALLAVSLVTNSEKELEFTAILFVFAVIAVDLSLFLAITVSRNVQAFLDRQNSTGA